MAAIAFGGLTDGGGASDNPRTFSATTSGSNRILFLGIRNGGRNTEVAHDPTYNGVSMTKILFKAGTTASEGLYLYYLIAPATGSNTISISNPNSDNLTCAAWYYTNAKQSGVPDASTSVTDNTSPLTATLTTALDNCWTTLVCRTNTNSGTAGTSTTSRQDGGIGVYDSNTAIVTAGSTSLNVNHNGAGDNFAIMASFAPTTETYSLTAVLATFTLTGIAATLAHVWASFVSTVQTFTFTGIAASFSDITHRWSLQSKNTTTFTLIDKS